MLLVLLVLAGRQRLEDPVGVWGHQRDREVADVGVEPVGIVPHEDANQPSDVVAHAPRELHDDLAVAAERGPRRLAVARIVRTPGEHRAVRGKAPRVASLHDARPVPLEGTALGEQVGLGQRHRLAPVGVFDGEHVDASVGLGAVVAAEVNLGVLVEADLCVGWTVERVSG